MASAANELRERLGTLTGTEPGDWFPVFKARYGMLEVFRALGAARPARRDVLTQLLTCSTAVDPILVAGLTPAYGEISPLTFSLDPGSLSLPDAPAAVVIQHTFGVMDQAAAREVADAARAAGALVVEDSAHCVTRMARDDQGAPIADVSIHSFGVEKMLPTKFGGAVWVNPALADAQLRSAITSALSALPPPGTRLGFAARTYRWSRAAVSKLPGGASVGRALERARLFSPAVSQAETEGRLAHEAVGITEWAAREVVTALDGLEAAQRRRLAATGAYAGELGGTLPAQPLVRFPVLVPAGVDAGAVVAGLRAQGIYAGTWYRPALFPGAADPAAYNYVPGDPAVAVTEDVIARIVNLPTDVTEARAREIAAAYVGLTRPENAAGI